MITRHLHTDFMTVMNMDYGMIDILYRNLIDLLEAEASQATKVEDGKR